MNKFTKEEIVTALIDCFGYSADEFENETRATIVYCMTDEQKETVKEYLN